MVRELIREAVIKGVGDERDHTVARKKKTKMGGREYGRVLLGDAHWLC